MNKEKQLKKTDIYNETKFKQGILFEDLLDDSEDKRTGTDIDYMWENGEVYVFAEVKEYGKKIPLGQKIVIERLARDLEKKKVYGFLLWHYCNENTDILIKDCLVAAIYWNNKWIDYRDKLINFKTAFNKIIKK
tara:strand:- start:893 stop:1294 length:402 start_codon:yes stop_codon:yes gene_type:complete